MSVPQQLLCELIIKKKNLWRCKTCNELLEFYAVIKKKVNIDDCSYSILVSAALLSTVRGFVRAATLPPPHRNSVTLMPLLSQKSNE